MDSSCTVHTMLLSCDSCCQSTISRDDTDSLEIDNTGGLVGRTGGNNNSCLTSSRLVIVAQSGCFSLWPLYWLIKGYLSSMDTGDRNYLFT